MVWTDPATGEQHKTSLDYVHPAYRERAAALLAVNAPDDPIAEAHLALGRVNQLKDLAANHQLTKAVAAGNIRTNLSYAATQRKRAQKK